MLSLRRAPARTGSASFGHAAGAYKIGVDSPALVDPHLRVHGLERIPTAPTNALTFMVAGKAG